MSIRFRQLEPKARGRRFFANLCLVVGLLLWIFVHPAGTIERDCVHAICGFLLGLSITVNLLTFWSSNCRRDTEQGKL